MKYKFENVRKFAVAAAAFGTAVVAVVFEAAVGLYGDGHVDAGEYLTLTLLALNAIATFQVPNDPLVRDPLDEVGEEIPDPLSGPHAS